MDFNMKHKNITMYDGIKTVIPAQIIIESFNELYDFLHSAGDISCKTKNENSLWSPCLVSGNRSNKNFVQMNFLSYDIDTGNLPENVFDNIEYTNITYRTFSYKNNDKKYRIIFEISKSITSIHEFHYIWNLFADYLEENHGIYIDRQCKDVSRGYYLPCKTEHSIANVIYRSGKLLSFDHITIPEATIQKPIKILPAQIDNNYYYVSILDKTQNDFGDAIFYQNLERWISTRNGEHYTAFYGMISAVKHTWARTHKTEIPDDVLEQAMCEIDSVGCNYAAQPTHGISYIRKKISENR